MCSITGEGVSTLGGPLHSVYFFVTSSLRLAAMLFSSRATLVVGLRTSTAAEYQSTSLHLSLLLNGP